MTDSPSPIDSSFDLSDVATPCTVIAAKIGLRNQKEFKENEVSDDEEFSENEADYTESSEKQETHRAEHEEISSIYVDDFSKEFGETASSIMEPLPKPHTFSRTITKVYCHIDDQKLVYMIEVHVPSDCITLRDVKRKWPGTNFKYYCIVVDPDTGIEVKAEVRDDSRLLHPSRNGLFELYMITVEGSVHSDTSSGRQRRKQHSSSKGSSGSREYQKAAYQYDNNAPFSDDESQASSLPTYIKNACAYNRRLAPQTNDRHHPQYKHPSRHHQNYYEESTFDITTESDDHYRDGVTYYDEDEDDSRSINTDLTSVSQQYVKQRWKQQQQRERKNRWKRMPSMSTASSTFSSITESSMSVEEIEVSFNLDSILLGIVPTTNKNARGEDDGLFVGKIIDRQAAALDGRIEVGDMIIKINDISLGNYSTKKSVQLLKNAIQHQFVKLTVVKNSTSKRSNAAAFPRNPRAEPIRPIDTNEWLKHTTNAMKAMPSISEESCSTPIPDEWPTNSSASGTPFGGPPPSPHCMTVLTDKKYVVEVMAAPGSGLEIKDRVWLKLPFPMAFWGTDLVKWLLEHIQGLQKKEDAMKFAEEMLKLGYIQHVVKKKKFTEHCYYVMGEECADYTQLRAPDGGYKYPPSQASSASAHSSNNNIFPPSMYPPHAPPPSAAGASAHQRKSVILPSMVSGYASMPTSPFPNGKPSAVDCGRTRDDQRSQTSGSSRGSSKRYVELPRKPSSLGSGSGISDQIQLDRVASRSSFRAAMSGSLRQFNID